MTTEKRFERANLVGYVWLVEQSVWSPFLLKLSVGVSETQTEDIYLSYITMDGKNICYPEQATKAPNEYQESWVPFSENLYICRNGQYILCWGTK